MTVVPDRALDLLRRRNRPTAVFAGNDLQALGVYHAARTSICGSPPT